MKMENMFGGDEFTEKRIEMAIDDEREYEKIIQEAKEAIQLFENTETDDEIKNVIEEYLWIINKNVEVYTKYAFQAGFDDCMEMLKRLGITR